MFGNIHRLKLNNMSLFGRLESGRVTMEFSSMLSKSRNPEVHCSSPANKKTSIIYHAIDQTMIIIHMIRPSLRFHLRPKSRYNHTVAP